MKTKTCKDCVYFDVCGDIHRTEKCDGREAITKHQAKRFYKNLCETVYGNANKCQQGVMSIGLIADHMDISIEKANQFCNAMLKYKITERSNGQIVV